MRLQCSASQFIICLSNLAGLVLGAVVLPILFA
jgi:hypothetical protein